MGYPVTLNGRTYTLADFTGQNYVSGFPDALEDYVTDAATQVAAAASSATDAATSATAAAGSATAALNSAVSAQASLDAIEGLYLGAQSSNPTVDLNGDALTAGDWYFNTTDNTSRVYDGSAWNTIDPAVIGDASPQLGGDLDVNGYSIVSASNGDIAITPNGTGKIVLDGLNFPTADGTSGQVLTTNGAGQLSFVDSAGGDLVDDTTPQLGGTLDFNGNIATSFESTGIDDNATSTALVIDSGGDVSVTANGGGATNSGDITVNLRARFGYDGTRQAALISDANTNKSIAFDTSGSERARIDTVGRMGVGVTSPTRGFEAAAYSGQQVIAHFQTTNASASRISFSDANTTSDAHVGIGSLANDLAIYAGGQEVAEFTTSYVLEMNAASSGNEGSQIDLSTTGAYTGKHSIDVYQDRLRFLNGTAGTTGGIQFYVAGNSAIGMEMAADGELQCHRGITIDGGDATTGVNLNIESANPEIKFKETDGDTWWIHVNNSVFYLLQDKNADGAWTSPHPITINGPTEVFQVYDAMYINSSHDLHVDGNVVAYSTSISDERLKDDVQPITGALDTVDALRGVTFTWNDGSRKGQRDYGLIAQQVEQIIPEIVYETDLPLMKGDDDKTTYKTIDYDKLVSVLVEAVSELRAEVEALKNGR